MVDYAVVLPEVLFFLYLLNSILLLPNEKCKEGLIEIVLITLGRHGLALLHIELIKLTKVQMTCTAFLYSFRTFSILKLTYFFIVF